MNPKQMARAGALGRSFFLAAFVTVLAHVAIAGPAVTVYKSPT
jgi:hypothetical protein